MGAEAAARPAAVAEARPGAGLDMVMIDNEDSFVHTLADYFRQTGARVRTYRWGMPADELAREAPDLVVHSPGPGRPGDFGVPALVRALAGHRIPQFGVCLGLQGIVEAFGGEIEFLDEPRHGKTWRVCHDGGGAFAGLPSPFAAGAYHSLTAVRATLPETLRIGAWTGSGLVMAVRHKALPIEAVQFHPESILSMADDAGHRLIRNVVANLAAATVDAGAAALG